MTAGASDVAYTIEDEFNDGPATEPTWTSPGLDVTVSDLTVNHNLERKRHPQDPTPAFSVAGRFEGTLSVTFSMAGDEWHDLVFPDGGTGFFEPYDTPSVPTSTWYFNYRLPDGGEEARTPTGAVVTDATVNYNVDQDVTVDLTMLFADEPDDVTGPTEGSIVKADPDDLYRYHGADFTVDGLGQTEMQSATLSLSNINRLRWGQSRIPLSAANASVEPTFSTDAHFTERDQLALAVDNSRDFSVESVDATFELENGAAGTVDYALEDVRPQSYSWESLVEPDSDLSEPIEYQVSGVSVV